MRCPECNYNLRHNRSGACPECGHPLAAPMGWSPDLGVKWAVGVGVAMIPIGYGLRCLIRGQAVLIGRGGERTDLFGLDATLLSIAIIAVGCGLHALFFWGNSAQLAPWSDTGFALAAIVFIGALVILGFRLVAF